MNTHLLQSNLHPNDEVYTRIEDVAQELSHYKQQLRGKRVYCPCDDYRWSAFPKFFKEHFHEIGLAHLTCTCIDNGDGAVRYDYDGENELVTLISDGDFRGAECSAIKDECDIIVTNPPFSLFRKFVVWIGGKDFLVICPKLAYTNTDTFGKFKDGKLRYGYTSPSFEGNLHGFCKWMTTLPVDDIARRKLPLNHKYSPLVYPKFDHFDAINVNAVCEIPYDYYGTMAVPVTAIDFDLSGFDILGMMAGEFTKIDEYNITNIDTVNGKKVFKRLIIKRKPMKTKPSPIVKWVGGKRKLAAEITSHFGQCHKYFEPFAGGAAVMLELAPKDAVVADINPELINMYQVVKEFPRDLCDKLASDYEHRTNEESYYEIRNKDRIPGYLENDSKDGRIDRAARFLYLNKTGFNGLWRVNAQGQNNVAYGKYKNPCVLDRDSIMGLSEMLNTNNISFRCQDYQTTVMDAGMNDLVYMDPPYDIEAGQNGFTSYSKSGFNRENQRELKSVSDRLLSRGCKVFISNSNTEFIRNLYGNDSRYIIHEIEARRSVGCNADSRKKITELLIEGKPLVRAKPIRLVNHKSLTAIERIRTLQPF